MVALILLLMLSAIDGFNCMQCLEGADCELNASCDECSGVACTRVTSHDVHDNNGLALTCVPFDTRNLLEPILIEEGCYMKGKKESLMIWSKLLLLSTIFLVLPQESLECATNGLCGYQPTCGSYYPPPQPSCGCQRSYGCGSYGCYRLRARGSKLYQPKRSRARASLSRSESQSTESQQQEEEEMNREVLRKRLAMDRVKRKEKLSESDELLLVSPTVARNRRADGPINPDRAFYECCIDRKLPDACLEKCRFASFTKQSLTAMYFKQDPCPLAAMSEMQFCAAQGRDHRACCARNGVTTTLAGEKCLSFCDQRLGHPQQLDMSYVPCFDRFESMKSCFWHDLTTYYRKA